MAPQQRGVLLSPRICEALRTLSLSACTLFAAVMAFVVVSGQSGEVASTPAPANAENLASTVVATEGESQSYSPGASGSLPGASPHWVYLVGSETHASTLTMAMREANVMHAHERGTALIHEIKVIPADADAAWYLADAPTLPGPAILDEIRAASGLPPLRVVDLR